MLQAYESRPSQTALDVALQFSGELRDLTDFLRANDVLNGEVNQMTRRYAVPTTQLAVAQKTLHLYPSSAAVTVAAIDGDALISPSGELLFSPDGSVLISPQQNAVA